VVGDGVVGIVGTVTGFVTGTVVEAIVVVEPAVVGGAELEVDG